MFIDPTRTGSAPWMLSSTILLNCWSTCSQVGSVTFGFDMFEFMIGAVTSVADGLFGLQEMRWSVCKTRLFLITSDGYFCRNILLS